MTNQYRRFPQSRTGGYRRYSVEDWLRENGVEVHYSSAEVAVIFGYAKHWVHQMKREGKLVTATGEPIEPTEVPYPKGVGRAYRWTASQVRTLAISLYNSGTIGYKDLKKVVRQTMLDEDDMFKTLGEGPV